MGAVQNQMTKLTENCREIKKTTIFVQHWLHTISIFCFVGVAAGNYLLGLYLFVFMVVLSVLWHTTLMASVGFGNMLITYSQIIIMNMRHYVVHTPKLKRSSNKYYKYVPGGTELGWNICNSQIYTYIIRYF